MKPIKFKECNIEFAKDQDEYKTLHSFYDKDAQVAVFCYSFSFWDKLKILFNGKLWLGIMTHGKPLQPQLLSMDKSDLLKK